MDTMSAFAMGDANRGKKLMVFDWNKAARLIKDQKPLYALAGLRDDWEWTGGGIWKNNAPVPKDETYTYLASTWAVPELNIDGDIMDCYIMEDDAPKDWDVDKAKTYWPDSALEIINSQS